MILRDLFVLQPDTGDRQSEETCSSAPVQLCPSAALPQCSSAPVQLYPSAALPQCSSTPVQLYHASDMSSTSPMSTMTHVTLQHTEEDPEKKLEWSYIEWAENEGPGVCQAQTQTEGGAQTDRGGPEQSERGTQTDGGTQTERGTQTSSPLIMHIDLSRTHSRLRHSSLVDSEGLPAPFFHFDRQAPGRISTSPTLRRMRSTRRPQSEYQETAMSPTQSDYRDAAMSPTQEEPSPTAPLSPLSPLPPQSPLSPVPRIISPLALSGNMCQVQQHISSSGRQRTKSHRSKTFDNGITFPRPERHSLHLSLSTDFVFPDRSESKAFPWPLLPRLLSISCLLQAHLLSSVASCASSPGLPAPPLLASCASSPGLPAPPLLASCASSPGLLRLLSWSSCTSSPGLLRLLSWPSCTSSPGFPAPPLLASCASSPGLPAPPLLASCTSSPGLPAPPLLAFLHLLSWPSCTSSPGLPAPPLLASCASSPGLPAPPLLASCASSPGLPAPPLLASRSSITMRALTVDGSAVTRTDSSDTGPWEALFWGPLLCLPPSAPPLCPPPPLWGAPSPRSLQSPHNRGVWVCPCGCVPGVGVSQVWVCPCGCVPGVGVSQVWVCPCGCVPGVGVSQVWVCPCGCVPGVGVSQVWVCPCGCVPGVGVSQVWACPGCGCVRVGVFQVWVCSRCGRVPGVGVSQVWVCSRCGRVPGVGVSQVWVCSRCGCVPGVGVFVWACPRCGCVRVGVFQVWVCPCGRVPGVGVSQEKELSHSRLQERRRSSVVVSLPGLDVSPGDLFVSNGAAHLLNESTLSDSKKSKWPFSRRSTTKGKPQLGSASDVEKHLSSVQIQDWRNVDLQKYKEYCVAEFLMEQLQEGPASDPQIYKRQEAVWELFTSDLEGKVKWLDNYQKVKQLRDALVWLPVWEREKRAFVPENLKHLLKAVTLENLITHRSLLHDGKLLLTENTKLLDVYLFLFDEFLLITKIKRNKKRSAGPDQNPLRLPQNQELEQLLKENCSFTVVDQPLSLDRVQVKNIHQLNTTSGLPQSFIIMHQNRYQQCIGAFILQAPSETAKRVWMSKVEDAVSSLLKQDSQQLRLKSASLWLESSQI
uniref:PH domain-containing protein n=1 Tax=Knipowitschia caucasica TaxID=637954 RepID=A0AAV2L567_KNICA